MTKKIGFGQALLSLFLLAALSVGAVVVAATGALAYSTVTVKAAKKSAPKAKTVKKSSAPASMVRELEGVWTSSEYYELQEGRWVKLPPGFDLGYFIIVKGKKICPRADQETGTLQCLGGEQGYSSYELVREGDGFVMKKDIIGNPAASSEKIIYRKKRLELIIEGMGTGKYILKKAKLKP